MFHLHDAAASLKDDTSHTTTPNSSKTGQMSKARKDNSWKINRLSDEDGIVRPRRSNRLKEQACNLRESSEELPVKYEHNAYSLFCSHAEVYPEKFRACVDYVYREKPRQLISCFITVLLLLFIAYNDIFPPYMNLFDNILPCGKRAEPLMIPKSMATGGSHVEFPIIGDRVFDADAFFANKEILKELDKEISLAGGFLSKTLIRLSLEEVQQFSRLFWCLILCAFIVVVGYSFSEGKDGLLVRPHPGFWRAVHGIFVLYNVCLAVFAVLAPADGRVLLRVLFSTMNPVNYPNYEGTLILSCALNGKNLVRQLTSFWFMCHVFGWMTKMLIVRSWPLCLIISFGFEFMEMSLQWAVPELKECWWDSFFLDAILSNIGGMLLGSAILRFVDKHCLDWFGAHPACKRMLVRFTPFSWGKYDWQFFRTPSHVFFVVCLVILFLAVEMNTFLLTTCLNVHVSYYIFKVRLGLLTLLAFPAVSELYAQVQFKHERNGPNVVLYVLTVCLEAMICVRYGLDTFKAHRPPPSVLIPWVVSGCLFFLWCYLYFYGKNYQIGEKRKYSGDVIDGKYVVSRHDIASICSTSDKLCIRFRHFLMKINPLVCFAPLLYLYTNTHLTSIKLS